VPVGDPFMEKLLLEACLEVMKSDALVGIQDMGAAGLTCSTCEMAARAGTGIDFDVTAVPRRETGMTPYETLLSESQERMLLVVRQGREAEVERIFERWDLHAVKIGTVTGDGLVRVRENGVVVAEIPGPALTDEAPLYDRPHRRPDWLDEARRLDASDLKPAVPPRQALLTLLASPTIASKRWVYRQYDSMVRTNTLVQAGLGAAVVRVKGTDRALAISTDCNGRFVYLDPKQGTMLAVAESARNVACAGGVPIGATNNLNFGNPQRPEIMWQLVQAVEGLGEACRAFEIPVTGGNVSLYNETDGRAILPTPVIGIVGLVDRAARVIGRAFTAPGQTVILIGENRGEVGGSEYLKTLHGLIRGVPPRVDLARERAVQTLLPALVQDGAITSAQDVSDGGLAVALAECTFDTGGIGVDVDIEAARGESAVPRADATLFGESAPLVIVACDASRAPDVLARAAAAGLAARAIGRTGGSTIRLAIDGRESLTVDVTEAEQVWAGAIAARMATKAAAGAA
jgi:phosphoribosylformylglycinamidine synthase subunit PurL